MSIAEFKREISAHPITTFPHVLVAIDFSEASRRALCDAVTLTADSNARVSVIHVLQPDWRYHTLENPPEMDLQRIDEERRLKAFVENVAPKRDIEVSLFRHTSVADAVVQAVNESDIDLVVIGTHGRCGLSKLALGSVAEELLRIAPCPVMTIGPNSDIAAITRGPGFHTILFATDFGQGSMAAVPLAVALGRAHHAKLILLHMISPMPASTGSFSAYAPAGPAANELEEWETGARKSSIHRLKECLPADHGLEQVPAFIVGTDFLAEGVLTAAAKFKVDLIVMGANRAVSARAAAHAPWSAVHEVVTKAPCPVLTMAG